MDSPAPRKIIHVDMDAFYASVEQRDDPSLRGLPIAVGGGGPRGVVATCSYEARTFGVRSAMPGARARRLCPDLLFVKPRFEVYRAVSVQIREIFARFTDMIQPLSLDEAYLDVTVNKPGIASATRVAQEIRRMIRAETGLTASAGVSYNKLIAKLASDQNKPDGICVVRPAEGAAFIAAMPVRRIHGVGPVTARRMQALGIETGADLRARDLPFLQAHFGSAADFYYRAARGEDDRPVRERQSRKSVSVEDTFFDDLTDRDALMTELDRISASLWTRIEKAQAWGRTVVLKVKFADFRIITRSRSFASPVRSAEQLAQAGRELLLAQLPLPLGARLLGLGVHNLEGDDESEGDAQLALAL
ncbi:MULTISPECIES: DNA polymerase IV [Sphingobium]|jgi:DNA polymerase IV|uniref:DNA polymerase IV n=1 Tax=Sphingobium TaxID=165695 RepID=UPI000C593302|nr:MULTISPECIES: DNA polymerase IV [Sphingobium]MBA38479.1 DNA polymerase IV [Sphingobium sp.]MEC9016883.1 DNA polymerase IV [Pseudomonadota bacterium]MBS50462.1 DNA polymerase IV [Sphingobium sp.]MCC4256403.1 DNA polymerase IV [Sphingobium lactosutens]HCW61660.1 DNA polymerase IV [Sphingobium sp.]|tara:strand:+ start:9425 stop:10507 length:1083 start_codon:yes stop_codon:yes gene_type:complete